MMRFSPVVLMLASLLVGCSYSSSNPSPPRNNTTIVVPPGTTVTCSNGTAPPCY